MRGSKELSEKLGRNDPCPCGSTRLFKKCCRNSGRFRWRQPPPLLSASEAIAHDRIGSQHVPPPAPTWHVDVTSGAAGSLATKSKAARNADGSRAPDSVTSSPMVKNGTPQTRSQWRFPKTSRLRKRRVHSRSDETWNPIDRASLAKKLLIDQKGLLQCRPRRARSLWPINFLPTQAAVCRDRYRRSGLRTWYGRYPEGAKWSRRCHRFRSGSWGRPV